MIKTKINGRKFELYDSIDEMPIKKFHKMNKMLLIDAAVGSDAEAVTERIGRILNYIDKDADKAKTELMNMNQTLFFIMSELNVRHKAFATMVHSVDGNVIYDMTDDRIDSIVDMISNEKVGVINRLIERIKKKIDAEVDMYFPQISQQKGKKNLWESYKMAMYYRLMSIYDDEDRSKAIDEREALLLKEDKVFPFFGKDNYEISYDKQFERSCNAITSRFGVEVTDKMTAYDFFNKLEFNADE